MGTDPVRSPRVLRISWGRIEVEGVGARKDFKLYPGGGRVWDWSETGTEHVPGIQPTDVLELRGSAGIHAVDRCHGKPLLLIPSLQGQTQTV